MPVDAPLRPRPSLPPVVAREVERRRTALLGAAARPVLDLRVPAARDEVRASAAGRPPRPARYATVVTAADLVWYPDLLAALTGIARCLTPEGEVRFVEPVQRPGTCGVLLGTLWSGRAALAGMHLQRDLPATLRAAGFTVTDLERFVMPTFVWPLRHLAAGAARRIPPPPAREASRGG